MDNTDKYIGMMLDNRYEILEQVGSGGMAVVYKARCHRLNRLVAVKILREEYAKDDDFRRRFHAESQAVAMLSHPNIVAVYDVNRSREIEYLVMELIDGITLIQYMSRRGVLNWREALHFTTQIVRALEHAHSRGIIHRDIKPHNIMVLRDGSVKVADFGIARFAASQNTLTQEALGSVHYISPEQAKGSHIDARSDIYSVGVVLYEMLTGRLPFEGDSAVSVAIQHINSMPLLPREIVPTIPEGLEEITMKAMASDISKRYVSANEMYRDLEEFRKNPNIVFSYNLNNYEITPDSVQEPTKKLPSVNGEARHVPNPVPQGGAIRKKESTMSRSKRPQGRSLAMFFAVMAVLLFVSGLFFFLWKVIGPIINPELDTIPVPELIGQMFWDVLDNNEYNDDFKIVEGDRAFDESLPGTIIDQKPAANRKVKRGETIIVTISKGRKYIVLESYKDKEWRNVESAILKQGLTVKEKIFETSAEVLKDNVIRTDPAAGSTLLEGEPVTLYISLGPAVDKVKMPSLIGRAEEAAISTIENANLTLGGITRVESDSPEGEVVWQSIEAGLEIDEGTVISLQVSLGPPTVPSTSPSQPPVESVPPSGGEDDEPVTKTVKIKLDQTKATLHVVVNVNREKTFDEVVDTSQEFIYVPVTGKGTVLVEIYFDGKLTYSDPLSLTQ